MKWRETNELRRVGLKGLNEYQGVEKERIKRVEGKEDQGVDKGGLKGY